MQASISWDVSLFADWDPMLLLITNFWVTLRIQGVQYNNGISTKEKKNCYYNFPASWLQFNSQLHESSSHYIISPFIVCAKTWKI